MPTFRLSNLGQYGILKDLKAYRLPANAFTAGNNVRFDEGVVRSVAGYQDLSPYGAETMDSIYWLQYFYSGAADWWVFPGLDSATAKVLALTLDGTVNDITPTGGETLTIGANDQWSGGPFMGNCIICNGRSSEVFYIDDPDGSALMQELEYSSGVDLFTKLKLDVVRPYLNFLIGMGVQVVGGPVDGVATGYYPNLVWWSDIAGPGEIPGSWQASDASTQSGYQPLGDLESEIIDGASLGDLFIVYTASGIHAMQYVGPPDVFSFRKISRAAGALGTNCVCQVEMAGVPNHVVLGSGDVYLFNGSSVESILDARWRTTLFAAMDPTYYKNSFVVAHQSESEVWICYPSAGTQYPDTALVWDYSANTVTQRDLPSTSTFAAWGRQSGGASTLGTINATTDAIDTVTTAFDSQFEYQPGTQSLLSVDESATVYRQDYGSLFDQTNPVCVATREGLAIEGNASDFKIVTELWPRIASDSGAAVQVRIGSREAIDADTEWDDWQTFTPGTDAFIPVRSNGRLHAWAVRSTNGSEWRMEGIDFTYEMAGRF
jgi:hypothetical protein